MDADKKLLEEYEVQEEARKAEEWWKKTVNGATYEDAARMAHKHRCAYHLLLSRPVHLWDDLDIISKAHLIADAEMVAKNPDISEPELSRAYQKRLSDWGNEDSPDKREFDEPSKKVELEVLNVLRERLHE